jgi:uncharacterized membrane protein YczE
LLEFFATNTPDQHHCTRNSCFGAFLSVWVHLEPFCNCTKLGAQRAKLVQLMQKLCRDVLLEFFATNAPDPQHWSLNSCFCAFLSIRMHLGPFSYCTKLAAKRAKLVQLMQKFVPRCLVRIFGTNAPDPHHWTLNSCSGAFLSVRLHFGPFCYYTKLAAKRAKLVQLIKKFVPRCLVRIFHNAHSRSTTLHPKLIFWCVSFHLGPFGTVLQLHET